MNAVEFVKWFGWSIAKYSLKYHTNESEKLVYMDWILSVEDVNDLKRLVESWEVIKTLGSLKSAKANLSEMYSDSSCDWVHENARLYDYKHLTVGRVNQAITDVESVGGGV